MAGIKGVIAKRHNGATQSGTGFGSGTPQGRAEICQKTRELGFRTPRTSQDQPVRGLTLVPTSKHKHHKDVSWSDGSSHFPVFSGPLHTSPSKTNSPVSGLHSWWIIPPPLHLASRWQSGQPKDSTRCSCHGSPRRGDGLSRLFKTLQCHNQDSKAWWQNLP